VQYSSQRLTPFKRSFVLESLNLGAVLKKHVKLYLDYFNYHDFIPCEVCGGKAVDIHHIDCRGMGSSKTKDKIENLMAVCRECHLEYGDKKQHIEFLKSKHNERLGNIKKN
jgi:5-methylcytosine-specific restriction endonuclease McrA